MPVQCVSCPFRNDNNVEWKVVLDRLAVAAGLPSVTDARAAKARAQIHDDVAINGEFHCHQSVYDQQMQVRPHRDHRQCLGATRWFKEQSDG